MSAFAVRFVTYVGIGAVVGLLVGLLLEALDVIANPFWGVAVGIMVAAVTLGLILVATDSTPDR